LKSQVEKPGCTMNWDWRKRVAFYAKLKPMSINRFDCELKVVQNYKPVKPYMEDETHIILKSDTTEVLINKKTGSVDKYEVCGKNLLNEGGIKIKAYQDNEDPWGMTNDGFYDCIGEFELISDDEANKFRGYPDEGLSNVRVIENGDARTKVQAIFKHNNSFATVTYIFPKNSKYLELNVNMLANDVNTLYKLSFDTTLEKMQRL
jgi:alpha-mannosidase